MQAETALTIMQAVQFPMNPVKRLALSVWADDGGTVIPGSGGEVVFHSAQSPEWTKKLDASRRETRFTRLKKR